MVEHPEHELLSRKAYVYIHNIYCIYVYIYIYIYICTYIPYIKYLNIIQQVYFFLFPITKIKRFLVSLESLQPDLGSSGRRTHSMYSPEHVVRTSVCCSKTLNMSYDPALPIYTQYIQYIYIYVYVYTLYYMSKYHITWILVSSQVILMELNY